MIQDHLQHNQMQYYVLLNIIYEMVQLELSVYMNIDKVIFLDNFSMKEKKKEENLRYKIFFIY